MSGGNPVTVRRPISSDKDGLSGQRVLMGPRSEVATTAGGGGGSGAAADGFGFSFTWPERAVALAIVLFCAAPHRTF
jgi:hypothetical protein